MAAWQFGAVGYPVQADASDASKGGMLACRRKTMEVVEGILPHHGNIFSFQRQYCMFRKNPSNTLPVGPDADLPAGRTDWHGTLGESRRTRVRRRRNGTIWSRACYDERY
jgi:hypothetical protein